MMERNDTKKPMKCREPCAYNKTSYTLSSSNFPSTRLWKNKLSASFPHYKTLEEAQKNLVKLVFYQEVMTRINEDQTAAYNFRNFIGELGGTLDLFIGISLMTVFKLLEWLVSFTFGKRKEKEVDGEEGVQENPVTAVKLENLVPANRPWKELSDSTKR